jgi:hypothetical protein
LHDEVDHLVEFQKEEMAAAFRILYVAPPLLRPMRARVLSPDANDERMRGLHGGVSVRPVAFDRLTAG